MSLQHSLLDIGELANFSDLSTFTQNIPVEWVESALQLSEKATIRRRRLPSEQVLGWCWVWRYFATSRLAK